MKILITGANGFIGSYLMEFFSERRYEVVGTVRSEENIKKGFKYIVGDLSDGIKTEGGFDAIVHCAAELDKEIKPMERYVKGNIIATQKILEYARKYNINRIINLSGVRCFGKVIDNVISESTDAYAPERYGMTKAVAEKMLLDSEVPTISLILPGVVGKKGHTPWIMRISRDLLENKTIDCYDPDAVFNNIIHVGTLAQNVEMLLTSTIVKNERVLLGSRNFISKYDVLDFLRKGLNSNSDIKIVESTYKSFYLDVSKAKNMNFILPTVEQELEKLIEELKN